jgi:hypothetical protein
MVLTFLPSVFSVPIPVCLSMKILISTAREGHENPDSRMESTKNVLIGKNVTFGVHGGSLLFSDQTNSVFDNQCR